MEKVLLGAFYCLLLLSPAEAGSWICGSDFCTEGEEFCRPDKRTGEDTCHRCDNYKSLCFQDGHESNCTLWCTAELERSIRDEVKKELENQACGDPPEVLHGKYNSAKTSFKQGEQITITCINGYRLMGNGKITCERYGQWSKTAWCEVITCLVPDAPEHGHLVTPIDTTGNQKPVFQIGQAIQYACLHDFKQIGEGIITCNAHGQTSHQPPLCIAEKPEDGKLQSTLQGYKIATFVLFFVLTSILFGVACYFIKRKSTAGQQKRSRTESNAKTETHTTEEEETSLLYHSGYYIDTDKPESKPTEQISEPEYNSFEIDNEQTKMKTNNRTKKCVQPRYSNCSSDTHIKDVKGGQSCSSNGRTTTNNNIKKCIRLKNKIVNSNNNNNGGNNNNNNNNNNSNNISMSDGNIPMITSNDSVGGRRDSISSSVNNGCLVINNNSNNSSEPSNINNSIGSQSSIDNSTITPNTNNNNNNNINQTSIHIHNHVYTNTDNVPDRRDANNAGRQDADAVTTICVQEHGNEVQEENDKTETERKVPSLPRYVSPRDSVQNAENFQPVEDDDGEKAINTVFNDELPTAGRQLSRKLSGPNILIQEQNLGREKIAVGSREADSQDFGT